MSRRPQNPLCPLLEIDRQYLRQMRRSQVAPAIEVARAKGTVKLQQCRRPE